MLVPAIPDHPPPVPSHPRNNAAQWDESFISAPAVVIIKLVDYQSTVLEVILLWIINQMPTIRGHKNDHN